jgi:hypothetical protein
MYENWHQLSNNGIFLASLKERNGVAAAILSAVINMAGVVALSNREEGG